MIMGRLMNVAQTVVVAVAPVMALAPKSTKTDGARAADELVWTLRAEGLQGRELVDAAMARVAGEYTHDSLWHMWELPDTSLERGRGWSHQYNTVLLDVLRGLGWDAHLVHAARVRGFSHPWWCSGHAWVKVMVDGRPLDACASREDNKLGDLAFTPVTDELPYRNVTRLGMALALTPFVTVGVWRAWLTGRPVSPWIYRQR